MMNSFSRSMALKIAAVISFLLSAFGVVLSLPMIAAGMEANNNNPESIPYFVLMLGLVIGVIGMIAAYGAWKQQRWGVILTVIVNLVNALAAAPGILFAPTTVLFIGALVSVIGGVVIIVLCLWPDRKAVLA